MILANGVPGRIVPCERVYGTRPPQFPVDGDFPSPLANDLPSLPGRSDAEWLWVLLPPLPASGTTLVNDAGAYALVGPEVGTYAQAYRGLVLPASGAAQVYEAVIHVNVDGGVQGASAGALQLTCVSATDVGIAAASTRALQFNGVSVVVSDNAPAAGESTALLPLAGSGAGGISIGGHSTVGLQLLAGAAAQTHIAAQSVATLPLLRGLAAPVVARREVVRLVSRLATRVELWSPLHMEG